MLPLVHESETVWPVGGLQLVGDGWFWEEGSYQCWRNRPVDGLWWWVGRVTVVALALCKGIMLLQAWQSWSCYCAGIWNYHLRSDCPFRTSWGKCWVDQLWLCKFLHQNHPYSWIKTPNLVFIKIKRQFDKTIDSSLIPSSFYKKYDDETQIAPLLNYGTPNRFHAHHITSHGSARHEKVHFMAWKAQEADCLGITSSTMYFVIITWSFPLVVHKLTSLQLWNFHHV